MPNSHSFAIPCSCFPSAVFSSSFSHPQHQHGIQNLVQFLIRAITESRLVSTSATSFLNPHISKETRVLGNGQDDPVLLDTAPENFTSTLEP